MEGECSGRPCRGLQRASPSPLHLQCHGMTWCPLSEAWQFCSGKVGQFPGWVVGEIYVDEPTSLRVQCLGLRAVWINDILLSADVYGREDSWTSVWLPEGLHVLRSRIRAKGQSKQFRCSIEKVAAGDEDSVPWSGRVGPLLPDVIDGALPTGWISILMSNHHAEHTLHGLSVRTGGSHGHLFTVEYDSTLQVAPGQDVAAPLRLVPIAPTTALPCPVDLTLKVSFGNSRMLPLAVALPCRLSRGQSFAYTFRDPDGSVQLANAIAPRTDSCRLHSGGCPVLLTFHGTGVSARSQADSYKFKPSGSADTTPFTFGPEQGWLCAPTRHGAHNWEFGGRETAMAAVDALVVLSCAHPFGDGTLCPLQANANKLLIAGHSMGGHGAWHAATFYPDRTLAAMPLAGWLGKQTYGDANVFYRHDVGESFVSPEVQSMQYATFADNDVDRLASNLQGCGWRDCHTLLCT
eukprot:m.167024 g.167024  ORF g.167024 m.167024 type:complete len:463 (-) comp21121_c0_seq11:36-1424(-)